MLDGVEFARYMYKVLKEREQNISDALSNGAVTGLGAVQIFGR